MCPIILPRLLLRVSSDRPKRRRPNQDGIHHPLWGICLQDNVLWVEERWCHLPARDTAVLCRSATTMLKPMSMTSSSKPKPRINSSLTWKKPSTTSESSARNSIPLSVSSMYPLENYSDSSSATGESRLIQRRSMPLWLWMPQLPSRMSRSLQVAWQP